MDKPRVLFASEYSGLNTGYGVYVRELLKEMDKTGKYELAEHAAYCGISEPGTNKINQAALDLPWKVYPNLPNEKNNNEMANYKRDGENTFGKWRFDRICLDFKPTHVLTVRDQWMDNHVFQSYLRPFYNHIALAPVDSKPQRTNWYEHFMNADSLLTFTEWGKEVLDEEMGGLANTKGAAYICVNELFKPIKDKEEHKLIHGMPQDSLIVGTVMRNQKRKLFPGLLESFFELLKVLPPHLAKKTYLFLYTCYPDLGWDIPQLINDFGLGGKVYVPYVCRFNFCNKYHVAPFRDARTFCPHCGNYSAFMPGTQAGLTTEQLVEVYNLFDIYVQYSNCEGFGGPVIEAAACGIPVIAVDYSAMGEVVRKCNGYAIPTKDLIKEDATMAYRASPDNDELVKLLRKLIEQPRDILIKKGKQARDGVDKYFSSWKNIADIWMDCIDNSELKGKQGKWDSPPRLVQPNPNVPKLRTNNEFVIWCIINILQEPELLYSKKHIDWVSALNLGVEISYDESEYGGCKQSVVERQTILKLLMKRVEDKNFIERARVSQLEVPDFVQFAHHNGR